MGIWAGIGMDEVVIEIKDGQSSFRPSDSVAGTLRWQLAENPEKIELSLFWYTRGKGTRDVGVAASETIENPGAPLTSDIHDHSWLEMMRTPQFYLLWLMFACGSGAGLMIIGKLAKIVELQSGSKAGFILVALLAIGNASGRLVAGVFSDRIGRTMTMLIVFTVQALLMFTLRLQSQLGLLIVYSMLIGFNYGACLSLFPSATKDYFGIKNFGLNYGLVFTAWGAGGLVLPILSGRIFDATGSFASAYSIAGFIMIVAAGLTFMTKAPTERAMEPALKHAA